MTANAFYPVIPAISSDLHVSAEQVNLSVTFYMIVQGLAPSLWGAICDVMGRRPVYMVCFTMYVYLKDSTWHARSGERGHSIDFLAKDTLQLASGSRILIRTGCLLYSAACKRQDRHQLLRSERDVSEMWARAILIASQADC